MKTDRYSINLIWSSEDEAYLAQISELPGCIADGPTVEEAIRNLHIVAQEWIATAKELGRPIPEPIDLERYDERAKEAKKALVAKLLEETEKAELHVARRDLGPSPTRGRLLRGSLVDRRVP